MMQSRQTVLVCALALLLSASCGGPPAQRVIDAFAKGKTDEALLLEEKIRPDEENSALAGFLVDLSRELGGETQVPGQPLIVEDPEQLATDLDGHRQGGADSPWLALAAGALADAGGDKKKAAEHYAHARNLGDATDQRLSRALAAAEIVASGTELKNTLDAEVDGLLRPAAGLYGYLLPLENETTVKGELHSTMGETRFVATVAGWSYLYFSNDAKATPCGWGLSVRSGEVLVPRDAFERTRSATPSVVAEQGFVARAWDPLGKYVLITFPEGERKGYVAPVQIQWPDDADPAQVKAIPTPDIGFSGRMFWAEGYEGSMGGMMIDGRGRRVMFNTEGLRVKLATPSPVNGPTGTVSRRAVSPLAEEVAAPAAEAPEDDSK